VIKWILTFSRGGNFVPISEEARRRLAGMWGAYDFRIIRDKHFATASDLAENFLEYYTTQWRKAIEPDANDPHYQGMYRLMPSMLPSLKEEYRLDQELLVNEQEVRGLINEWAERRFAKRNPESLTVTTAHIMFRCLHYGHGDQAICFNGGDWSSKAALAEKLKMYKPWSIAHVIDEIGKDNLYDHMISIVRRSKSPTEERLFENWRKLSPSRDRPMLFPQVSGHTGGRFYLRITDHYSTYIHFDFGLVNVLNKKKLLIECDSKRYHSKDDRYQSDGCAK
jgi:hypothetical protein